MDIREKLKIYLEENLEKERKPFFKMRVNKSAQCDEECCGATIPREEEDYDSSFRGLYSEASISNYIEKELDENKFQKLLFKHIDSRGLKDSDVYNKALIDRRLFSKIRSDENYHPSKETVISLATSLELTVKELEELLSSASYSLPKNNKFDLIIRFCFKERIYDIMEINNLLDEYHCPLLTK